MAKTNNSEMAKKGLLARVLGATAGAAVLVGVGGYLVFEERRANEQQALAVLSEIRNLKQELGATTVKKDELQSMIVQTIESREADRQAKKVAALYAQAPLASDETAGRRIYGDMDARFTIVEYTDIECPFCKRFHSTPKQIVEGSKGNVNWQLKHLPLDFHNPAAKGQAAAAECVREQKGNRGFWVFMNEAFRRTGGNGQGVKDINQLVRDVGADEGEFRSCMQDGRGLQVVDADLRRAAELRLRSTPSSFVVDNKTGRSVPISGAQPLEAVVGVIRNLAAGG